MKYRASLISPRVQRISVRKQCELLTVNRSRVYYKPVTEKPENLKMMEIMDKHLTAHPTEGVKGSLRSEFSRPNLNLATWPFGIENGEYYSHSANSAHYRGLAADVNIISTAHR
jgi:hypothetical protein